MRHDRGEKKVLNDSGVVSDMLVNSYGIAGMVLIDIDYQLLCGKML